MDQALLSALDRRVAQCWERFNFSNVPPSIILDAANAYGATREFDYLES